MPNRQDARYALMGQGWLTRHPALTLLLTFFAAVAAVGSLIYPIMKDRLETRLERQQLAADRRIAALEEENADLRQQASKALAAIASETNIKDSGPEVPSASELTGRQLQDSHTSSGSKNVSTGFGSSESLISGEIDSPSVVDGLSTRGSDAASLFPIELPVNLGDTVGEVINAFGQNKISIHSSWLKLELDDQIIRNIDFTHRDGDGVAESSKIHKIYFYFRMPGEARTQVQAIFGKPDKTSRLGELLIWCRGERQATFDRSTLWVEIAEDC